MKLTIPFASLLLILSLAQCTTTPQAPMSSREFVAHKQRLLAQTKALDPAQRNAANARFTALVADSTPPTDKTETHSSVGAGVTFTPDFQTDFTTGTSFIYDIIIPAKAGGNLTTNLYLTSTNRAMKGVEALIAFADAAAPPVFWIFDWSLPVDDEWREIKTYVQLQAEGWMTTAKFGGQTCDIIRVQNRTYQVSPKDWRNQVLLYSFKSQSWVQVHAHRYPATLAEQHSWFWGPIVETFQPTYTGIAPMGFLNAAFATRHQGIGPWNPTSFTPLSPEHSDFNSPKSGFRLIATQPNHSFLVDAP